MVRYALNSNTSRSISPVPKKHARRLLLRQLSITPLEERQLLTGFQVNISAPAEVANKGVYVSIFGTPTTTAASDFHYSAANSTLTVNDASLFPANGSITLDTGTNHSIFNYTSKTELQNNTWVLNGLSQQGTGTVDFANGSVVSSDGNFVYLTDPSLPAPTQSSSAVLSDTVPPVVSGLLPVSDGSIFANATPTSPGNITIQPPGTFTGDLVVGSTAGFTPSGNLTMMPALNSPQSTWVTLSYTGIANSTTFTGITIQGTTTPAPGWLATQNQLSTPEVNSLNLPNPGQWLNATYTGIDGNVLTGVLVNAGFPADSRVVQNNQSAYAQAPMSPIQPTTLPVNSEITGFPAGPQEILIINSGTAIHATYQGISADRKSFTGVIFLDNTAAAAGSTIQLPDAFVTSGGGGTNESLSVTSTANYPAQGTLLVQAPSGYQPNPYQVSQNVAVSYTGKTGTSFTGLSLFPSGSSLPSLPSGGWVGLMANPGLNNMGYATAGTAGNVPLINLFPNAGTYTGTAPIVATMTIPDPALQGITSGVIVVSVGTPIALPFPASGSKIGSPTMGTNRDDIYGIGEFALTGNAAIASASPTNPFGILDFDVSEVDAAAFPFSMNTIGTPLPAPFDPVNGVGMSQDRVNLFNGFTAYLDSIKTANPAGKAGQFSIGIEPGVRLTAPQDVVDILVKNPPRINAVVPTTGNAVATTGSATYWVTAKSADGESMASIPVSGTWTQYQGGLSLAWEAYPYASSYNIYWGSTANGPSYLIANVPAGQTTFVDTTPDAHPNLNATTPPINNYQYVPLNSYYTDAIKQFFAYYAPTGTTVYGIPGAGNTFILEDDATHTRWTGQTETNQTINGNSGYTALVLTGSAGLFGDEFAGETAWVVAPLFAENTIDSSLGTLPPSPLTDEKSTSGSAMIFGGSGVFGGFQAATTNPLDVNDSKNLYNNFVSAFTRGLTPRLTGGTWAAVIPPTYWANSPQVQSATVQAASGTGVAAGAYRYFVTTQDISNDVSSSSAQTTPSNFIEVQATNPNNQVNLTWAAVNPALDEVSWVQPTNGGINYSVTTVTITGDGSGAAAEAVVDATTGAITGFTLTNPGSGYTHATATITSDTGTGATANVVIANNQVAQVTVNQGGSGYQQTVVSFSGGGGSGAAAEAVLLNGSIIGFTLTNPGSGYSSPPTVTISAVGGSGSGATAVANLPAFDNSLHAASFNVYRSQKINGSWGDPVWIANVPNVGQAGVNQFSDTIATPFTAPASIPTLFSYFMPESTANFYAGYFAQPDVSYNGLNYGYAYADKNNTSTNVQMRNLTGLDGLSIDLNAWSGSRTVWLWATGVTNFQGENLKIYGSGFSPIPANNQVTFTTSTGAAAGTGHVIAVNADGTEITVAFDTNPPLGELYAAVSVLNGSSSGAPVQVAIVKAATEQSVQDNIMAFTKILSLPGQGTIVQVFNAKNQLIRSFKPSGDDFHGAVQTVSGDFTGDQIPDLVVVGDGNGEFSKVTAWDGRTGEKLWSKTPFGPNNRYDAHIATGDFDGDGILDIIVAGSDGRRPQVVVYAGPVGVSTGTEYRPHIRMPRATEYTVAAADIDGDGRDEVVVGARIGGRSWVRIFDGNSLRVLRTFQVFAGQASGPLYVAAGDVVDNTRDEIIVSSGYSARSGRTGTIQRVLRPNGAILATFRSSVPNNALGVALGTYRRPGRSKDFILINNGQGFKSLEFYDVTKNSGRRRWDVKLTATL